MEMIVSDGFKTWYDALDEADRDAVYRGMGIIEARGVEAGEPCTFLKGSPPGRLPWMRVLDVALADHALRLFFFFHPGERAIHVWGGERVGG